MRAVIIVDTSVFMNIIDIPRYNQYVTEVRNILEQHINEEANLLLPMTAIFETGNHVAQLPQGRIRRSASVRFTEEVKLAIDGSAPWRPTPFPSPADMIAWLDEFPGCAMRGIGFGDLNIIKIWEDMCRKASMSRVLIWSLDAHLTGYDRTP